MLKIVIKSERPRNNPRVPPSAEQLSSDTAAKHVDQLPATLLKSARDFYMSRGKENFVLEVPFRPEKGASPRSLGNSISLAILATSSEFKSLREEFEESIPPLSTSALMLRDDLTALITFAARFTKSEVTKDDLEFFNANFRDKIDADLLARIAKEVEPKVKEHRKDEARRITAGELTEPGAPGEFARLQKIYTETLLAALTASDGTSLQDFISRTSGGRIQRIVPTGLWRDRYVSELIDAADETSNLAAKRRTVEQFLITLPNTARLAVEKRDDLTNEQKEKIRVAAQALYERATQLRTDRQNQFSSTTASDTARLNQMFATSYRILLKFNVIQPLQEPLDIPDRNSDQTETDYNLVVRRAVDARAKEDRAADIEFRTKRKPVLTTQLLEFMHRIEQDSDMRGIFPGTLGTVLSATGKEGRALYTKLIKEIESRPFKERFSKTEKMPPSTVGYPPYVVLDERTGTLKQPPNEWRMEIDIAYEGLSHINSRFDQFEPQMSNVLHETINSAFTDSVLLAKKIDVVEAELNISDAWVQIARARHAVRARGSSTSPDEPASLHWKATSNLVTHIGATEARIKHIRENIVSTRQKILLKLVAHARDEIKQSGGGSQFAELNEHLNDLELIARGKSDVDDVKEAIAFFLT